MGSKRTAETHHRIILMVDCAFDDESEKRFERAYACVGGEHFGYPQSGRRQTLTRDDIMHDITPQKNAPRHDGLAMTSHSSPPSLHGPSSMANNEERPFSDVGIAIAKKKKAEQQKKRAKEQSSPTNTSLRDFLYGASLYIACLGLPTLLGLTGLFDYKESSSSLPKEPSYYEQASEYICENWWSYWCPVDMEEKDSLSVHAPDTEWTDVGIVAFLSLSMAMIRLLLVHLLVPRYLAPKRLEALVRCKSVHLLSSAYPKSLTPQRSKQNLNADTSMIPPPPLFTEEELLVPEKQVTEEADPLSSSLHGVKQSLERYERM